MGCLQREQQARNAKAALVEQQVHVEELEKQQADVHNRKRRNMALRDRLRKELHEIEPRIACARCTSSHMHSCQSI
jgi:hypothetical protein